MVPSSHGYVWFLQGQGDPKSSARCQKNSFLSVRFIPDISSSSLALTKIAFDGLIKSVSLDCKSLWDFALEWILIPFSYSWFLKKIVLKLKYYHKKDVVDFLVDRVCLAIYANRTLSGKIEKWDVLVSWIPSHWHRRYFVKWYNQSFLLAQDLAKKLNLQYGEFLKKTKKTKSQASLDREWRLKNLKNAFDFKNEKILENIQTVILVDDVTTTWSTMNEVAKFIKSKYPKIAVRWIVLCRKSN